MAKKREDTVTETVTETVTQTKTVEGEIKIYKNPKPPILKPLESDSRRVHPRYEVKLDVLIFCAGVSYKTTTIDISVGGAQFEQMLPEAFMGKSLEILIKDPIPDQAAKKLLLIGRPIDSLLRTNRIRFDPIDSLRSKRLQNIFDFLLRGSVR